MASREDKINDVRQRIGDDYTKSVIGQALDSFDGDKEKVLEFFGATVGSDQANASFEECVEFLRKAMPIYGAPDGIYEECVRKADCNMSVAVDLLQEARDKIVYGRHSPSKPQPQVPKGPTASPIVSPPVYNPQPAAPAKKPLPEPAHAAPAPAPAAAAAAAEPEPAPAASAGKPLPEPSHPAPAAKPLPQPSVPVPKKELPENPAAGSADEMAKQKVAEFNKLLEANSKNSEERLRHREEQDKHLADLKLKQEELAARLKNPATPVAEKPKIEEQIHRNEIEQSRIQSELGVTVPPDYMIGRLPTDACVISPVVDNDKMVISFTWKIPDNVEVSPKDWIGLYIHDRQYSNKYESYVLLGGKREGIASFKAPTIGYFDLRYYPNNGSVEKSRSEPFLVGPKMNVEAKLQGRRKISVTWDRASETNGDWLALYPVSTYSNTKYLQQLPASSANNDGVVLFDAPRQPGEYEVRYFFTNKRHATGYAFSGRSQHIVIPNEDLLEVVATHPVVKVKWQTFSQEPNSSDWVGLYTSSDDKASRLGWEYLCKKGLMDSVGDHGVAEIEAKELIHLAPEGDLPEGSDQWEVRLFNKAPNQPFLRAPFIKH